MAITLTWGGTDINDGTTYALVSFDFGHPVVSYDTAPDYAGGSDRQINVRRTGLVLMTIVLKVTGTTAATRDTAIATLETRASGTSTLVYNDGGTQLSYNTLASDGPAYDRQTREFTDLFRAWVTLSILREAV